MLTLCRHETRIRVRLRGAIPTIPKLNPFFPGFSTNSKSGRNRIARNSGGPITSVNYGGTQDASKDTAIPLTNSVYKDIPIKSFVAAAPIRKWIPPVPEISKSEVMIETSQCAHQ